MSCTCGLLFVPDAILAGVSFVTWGFSDCWKKGKVHTVVKYSENLIRPLLEIFPAELQLQEDSVPLWVRRVLKQQDKIKVHKNNADVLTARNRLLFSSCKSDPRRQALLLLYVFHNTLMEASVHIVCSTCSSSLTWCSSPSPQLLSVRETVHKQSLAEALCGCSASGLSLCGQFSCSVIKPHLWPSDLRGSSAPPSSSQEATLLQFSCWSYLLMLMINWY